MDIQDKSCTASLKLLGDFWTLRIIDTLAKNEERFCDLQRAIGNCNPVTLTDRLKKLEQAKLINRNDIEDDNSCVTYNLTDLGRKAIPVVDAIDNFASQV